MADNPCRPGETSVIESFLAANVFRPLSLIFDSTCLDIYIYAIMDGGLRPCRILQSSMMVKVSGPVSPPLGCLPAGEIYIILPQNDL